MKTAAFATLFTYAATTLAAQQTFQLSANASPLQFVDAPVAGKRVLAASSSAAPVTLNNGLLSTSDSWTANLDGGLVTFSQSDSVSMPGNVSVNSLGVVSNDGQVQDWYLCNVNGNKALASSHEDGLDCEQVTLHAATEPSETIVIKAIPSAATIIIYGNEYPTPQQADMVIFWQGLAKALTSLLGTMALGGIVAYRGLQEKTFVKKATKTVSFE